MKRWIGCGTVAVVLPGTLLVLLVWAAVTYQGLTRTQIELERDWSRVENAYQHRLDLIPSLVATVGGLAAPLARACGAVSLARSEISRMLVTQELLDDPTRFGNLERAQAELSGALSRLMTEVDARPQLATKQDFVALRSELLSTEKRIALERSRFNDAAERYNAAIRTFPARVLAGILGFTSKQRFDAEAADSL